MAAIAVLMLTPSLGSAGGGQTTGCVNLCPTGWPNANPCVVTAWVNVVNGSVIDCGSRDVQITTGTLAVHDGGFTLKANSVSLNPGVIIADCPQASTSIGFSVQSATSISISGTGRMLASCSAGGGAIRLDAGTGDITLGGNGVQADGTAAGAPGGIVEVHALEGIAHVDGLLSASALGTTGTGGNISVLGNNIYTLAAIEATGANASGGTITLTADAWDSDILVGGFGHGNGSVFLQNVVDASGTSGDGGSVRATASGNAWIMYPIRVLGSGPASAGGNVVVEGDFVLVESDLLATGGRQGGRVSVVGGGYDMSVISTIDVTSTGGSGAGGSISLISRGASIGTSGFLKASGGGTGSGGGSVEIAGAAVLINSTVTADATSGGSGGAIAVTGKESMSLNNTMHAAGGTMTFVYRDSAPTVGSNVTGPYGIVQDLQLLPNCGDGLLRFDGEDCDRGRLNNETCAGLGQPSGDLRCSDVCTFDTTGCTGN